MKDHYIPVHGGEDDLAACLASLAPLYAEGLLHEVLVVDDASPDEEAIATVCAAHPFARLIRQPVNEGFSATCNVGPLVAATGPFTNRAGYGQQIDTTYTRSALPEIFAKGQFLARFDTDGGSGVKTAYNGQHVFL